MEDVKNSDHVNSYMSSYGDASAIRRDDSVSWVEDINANSKDILLIRKELFIRALEFVQENINEGDSYDRFISQVDNVYVCFQKIFFNDIPNDNIVEKPSPAVPPEESVHDEYLISLEDGKRYKALKRHLSNLGLSPSEYIKKWGLPYDYPMTCPSYSRRRSELAKINMLGKK